MEERKAVGRPIVDTPILNAVGLMRHLVGAESGANLRVAAEIETIAGRPVLPGPPAAAARRISDFVRGRKSVPEWVENAARQWCVRILVQTLKSGKVGLVLENTSVRLTASAMRELLAEGLVATTLSRAANHHKNGIDAILHAIDAIRN